MHKPSAAAMPQPANVVIEFTTSLNVRFVIRPLLSRTHPIAALIYLNYTCCTKTSGVHKICERLILLRCFYCSEYTPTRTIGIECCSHIS